MKEPILINRIIPSIPYTLDDYNEQIVKITARFAAIKAYEDLLHKNYLDDMLAMGYTPPTRWQKFKYRMQDLKQSVKDIWTIVSGGDIHKDCGY